MLDQVTGLMMNNKCLSELKELLILLFVQERMKSQSDDLLGQICIKI